MKLTRDHFLSLLCQYKKYLSKKYCIFWRILVCTLLLDSFRILCHIRISFSNLHCVTMPSFLLSGNSLRKTAIDNMRSTLSFDNKQPVFASQDIDYGQPIVRSMRSKTSFFSTLIKSPS